MGRPTKFNDARMETICSALRDGSTRKAAAEAAGVDFKTFLSWLERFSIFSTEVTRAEADCEAAMARVIVQAAKDGDWRASESWLKRRRRDEWGDSVDVRKLPDDTLVRLLEADAAARSGAAGLEPASNGNGKH